MQPDMRGRDSLDLRPKPCSQQFPGMPHLGVWSLASVAAKNQRRGIERLCLVRTPQPASIDDFPLGELIAQKDTKGTFIREDQEDLLIGPPDILDPCSCYRLVLSLGARTTLILTDSCDCFLGRG